MWEHVLFLIRFHALILSINRLFVAIWKLQKVQKHASLNGWHVSAVVYGIGDVPIRPLVKPGGGDGTSPLKTFAPYRGVGSYFEVGTW